jgi:hypothetical protein
VARALILRRPAFWLFVLAFVTELVRWVPMSLLPAYGQTWHAAAIQFRYTAWAVLLVVGITIGLAERMGRAAVSAKASPS